MSEETTCRRLRHLRRDPRVSLTVFDIQNWYWQLTLLGSVTTIEDDAGLSGADRLANRYIGGDYPVRDHPRVNVWMDVESWNGWDPVRLAPWARPGSPSRRDDGPPS